MPCCKNIPDGEKACYYKGDENTPRGKGLAAQFEEGKNRKGMDGNMYVAKNGRWVKKVSSSRGSRKTSPKGLLSMTDGEIRRKILIICKTERIRVTEKEKLTLNNLSRYWLEQLYAGMERKRYIVPPTLWANIQVYVTDPRITGIHDTRQLGFNLVESRN